MYGNNTYFVQRPTMRFHFNLRGDEGLIPDKEGSDLADLEAARAEARATAKELAIEDMRNGKSHPALTVEIADPNGVVVESVRLDVALTTDNALSATQFASLREVGRSFLHAEIPAEDAVLLLDRGLIYCLLGCFRITAAGKARVVLGS